MLTDIRTILRRCAPTMAQDAAGVVVLAVLLTVGLHLPYLI